MICSHWRREHPALRAAARRARLVISPVRTTPKVVDRCVDSGHVTPESLDVNANAPDLDPS
jgi:hypothetical protein